MANPAGALTTYTLRGKLGATTLCTLTPQIANTFDSTVRIELIISAYTSAAQKSHMSILMNAFSSQQSLLVNNITSTEDCTVDKTLAITCQMNVANATTKFDIHTQFVEYL